MQFTCYDFFFSEDFVFFIFSYLEKDGFPSGTPTVSEFTLHCVVLSAVIAGLLFFLYTKSYISCNRLLIPINLYFSFDVSKNNLRFYRRTNKKTQTKYKYLMLQGKQFCLYLCFLELGEKNADQCQRFRAINSCGR